MIFAAFFGAKADILIELQDVLYIADIEVLCNEVLEQGYITSPPTGYCASAANLSPVIANQQLILLRLKNVRMNQLIVTEPAALNGNLTDVSFFPGSNGKVKILGDHNDSTWLVWIIGSIQFFIPAILGFWLYWKSKRD